MNILPEISMNSKYLEEIYKDLHSHPELGFEEERTSQIVQEKLKEYGVDEIHTHISRSLELLCPTEAVLPIVYKPNISQGL